jgi:hypothetical protein
MRTPIRTLLAGLALAAFTQLAVAAQADLRKQVADAERAFAKTMADRDFTAFQSFLAEEAIFFSGERATRAQQRSGARPFRQDRRPVQFDLASRSTRYLARGVRQGLRRLPAMCGQAAGLI